MTWLWVLACLALAGCGRIGFDALTDGGNTVTGAGGPLGWTSVGLATVDAQNGRPSLVARLPFAAGAGDLLVVATQLDLTATAAVTDDAGTTYTRIAASHATNTADQDAVELWYAATVAAATKITVAASNVYTVIAWDFQTTQPAAVEAAAARSDQPATTAPESPAITTASEGELVIAAAIDTASISGLAGSGFTEDSTGNMNGWAHVTDRNAPAGEYQAQWVASSGTYGAAAVAFAARP